MFRRLIYLDTAAATPLDRSVWRAMSRARWRFANPASWHRQGVAAAAMLADARRRVARQLMARPQEILFLPSATAANNLVVRGIIPPSREAAEFHFVSTQLEHSSVREPLLRLAFAGARVTWLPTDAFGRVAPAALADALTSKTVLVSIGYANSETGVIQDLSSLARVIREYRETHRLRWPYFHTDAAQATRFLPLNMAALGVDLLTISGRKIYGPAVGVLFARRDARLTPIIVGGGQEDGRWAGTEDLPAIAGLATALELVSRRRGAEGRRLSALRNYFFTRLRAIFPELELNGSLENSLPHCLNVSFPGADAEYVVLALDAASVAVSAGSACALSSRDHSYVIEHLRGATAARSAVRFTLDRQTTRRQLDYVLRILPPIIHRARFDGLINGV